MALSGMAAWEASTNSSYGEVQQSIGMAHTAEELGMPKGSVSDEDIAEYREIFSLVDLDHGGTIDCEELGELMDLLGMNVTDEEVEQMVNEIDSTGEGEVNFADFVRVVSKKVDHDRFKRHELLAAFQKFENGAPPGHMKVDDLAHLLMKHAQVDEAKATEMVDQMEPNKRTGLVNYSKYVNLMLS